MNASDPRSDDRQTLASLPGDVSRAPGTAPDEEAICRWLIAEVAKLAEIPPQGVDPQQTFALYGLDSMQAARLSGDLESWIGYELPPSTVYDYPTIESLSRYLSGGPIDPAPGYDAGP